MYPALINQYLRIAGVELVGVPVVEAMPVRIRFGQLGIGSSSTLNISIIAGICYLALFNTK